MSEKKEIRENWILSVALPDLKHFGILKDIVIRAGKPWLAVLGDGRIVPLQIDGKKITVPDCRSCGALDSDFVDLMGQFLARRFACDCLQDEAGIHDLIQKRNIEAAEISLELAELRERLENIRAVRGGEEEAVDE